MIPILLKAILLTFGDETNCRKAIAERGWNPLNMALLKLPEILGTAVVEDLLDGQLQEAVGGQLQEDTDADTDATRDAEVDENTQDDVAEDEDATDVDEEQVEAEPQEPLDEAAPQTNSGIHRVTNELGRQQWL